MTARFASPRGSSRRVLRLSVEQVDALVAGYLEGKTVYELGAQFGVGRQTVSVHLRRRGVTMRMGGVLPADCPELLRLRDQGWSFARLGERFGVDPDTARRVVRLAGRPTA
ncbi:MAG: hypothetical protein FWF02_04470 [Micrococcales bacterium]|nr:hypothetical protein [Micrococcales bacterium]MCL2666946.1 hypothetical protein [Micrococcales bacterium]